MKLIIGLGNPGTRYGKTRHNIGFRVIEELKEVFQFKDWTMKMQFNAFVTRGLFNNEKIILAKPQTFMNNSGMAVQTLTHYYKIPVEDILVIHDEIDLPLGEIKIQQGRSSAGHKGVQSIIDQLGSNNFIRIRVGMKSLGNTRDKSEQEVNVKDFVLQKFSKEEEELVEEIIKKTATKVVAALP